MSSLIIFPRRIPSEFKEGLELASIIYGCSSLSSMKSSPNNCDKSIGMYFKCELFSFDFISDGGDKVIGDLFHLLVDLLESAFGMVFGGEIVLEELVG